MTAEDTTATATGRPDRTPAPTGAAPAGRSPGSVVFGRTVWRCVRSGALWGVAFGVFVAVTASSYSTIYRTRVERDALATAFGTNRTTTALFGPAPDLQTVAGFTVFKVFLTITVIGAVWGLLTSTRLLRGEEDAGRWELLLSGATTPGRATAQTIAGLAGGIAAMWLTAALIVVASGRSAKVGFGTGPGLFFALALTSGAVVFAAVGAVTSQIAPTRRQAAGYAGMLLGASYALRLVADSGTGLHWLVWASPLGWIETLRPLTSPDARPLVVIALAAVVLSAGAVLLASRRDVGAGIVADHDRARPRFGLLSGSLGLTVRLVRPTVVAWATAVVIAGLLFGLISHDAAATLTGSSVRQVFTRLGAPGIGPATYLGVTFLFVAILLGFVAAAQVSAARSEELEGRLDPLLARPVLRTRWLGDRLVVALGALVVCAVLGGLATLVGAVAGGARVDAGSVIGAGLNTLPPSVCILGIGILAYGILPRIAGYVVYAVVTWSVVVDLVGGIGSLDHWVADTSLFRQMSAAPAVPPDWQSIGVLVALGVVAAIVGVVAFARRDIQSP